MSAMKAINGKAVSDEMLDSWCKSLDNDEWPEGWHNVGEIVEGKPPSKREKTEVLSVKIPSGMKRAIEARAKDQGVSTSTAARRLLENALLL